MRRVTMLPLLAVATVLGTGCAEELLTPGPTEATAQEAATPRQGERLRGRGMRFRGGPGGMPLQRLIEQREALGLTAEQVSRLEVLSAELAREREALRAKVEAEVGERPRRPRGERTERPQLSEEERAALREEMRARREALRPHMELLRAHHRETMDEVREILTDEQEAKLRALRQQRHEAMRERRG